jgi:hypothetical protein
LTVKRIASLSSQSLLYSGTCTIEKALLQYRKIFTLDLFFSLPLHLLPVLLNRGARIKLHFAILPWRQAVIGWAVDEADLRGTLVPPTERDPAAIL